MQVDAAHGPGVAQWVSEPNILKEQSLFKLSWNRGRPNNRNNRGLHLKKSEQVTHIKALFVDVAECEQCSFPLRCGYAQKMQQEM